MMFLNIHRQTVITLFTSFFIHRCFSCITMFFFYIGALGVLVVFLVVLVALIVLGVLVVALAHGFRECLLFLGNATLCLLVFWHKA